MIPNPRILDCGHALLQCPARHLTMELQASGSAMVVECAAYDIGYRSRVAGHPRLVDKHKLKEATFGRGVIGGWSDADRELAAEAVR